MSNLSLLFLRFSDHIRNPLTYLLQALGSQSPESRPFEELISALPVENFKLVLEFYTICIEDVVKQSVLPLLMNSTIKETIFADFRTAVSYVNFLLQKNSATTDVIFQTSHTISAWMSYIPNISGECRYSLEDMSPFIDFLFYHFKTELHLQDEAIADTITNCMNTFTEVLETNPTLLSTDVKLSLYSILFAEGEWGEHFLNSVILTDMRYEHETEVMAFVDLVSALAQLNSIRISKTILESMTQNILRRLFLMSSIPGVPFIDESVSERTLIFWEELANVYEDSGDVFEALFESKADPAYQQAFEHEKTVIFEEVAKIYWTKIRYQDADLYLSMKTDFNSYRSNVADLFLVIYNILKSPFYATLTADLVERIHQLSKGNCDLADLEASLFLLYKINDDSAYFESQSEVLLPFSKRILESGLIEAFASVSETKTITTVASSTLIQYLASNIFFFKLDEGYPYLRKVFDFLFPLIVGQASPTSLLASKTATKICEECSTRLLGILPDLELIVIEMLRNPSIDSLIRLRMFNAYSVIARSINEIQEHAHIIHGAVTAVKDASKAMIESVSDVLQEEQEEYLLSLLSCIVNIAKGSGLPDEMIEKMLDEEKSSYSEFWSNDSLQVKPLVLSILGYFSMEFKPMAQKTLVVEKCVNTFKAGLREELGGPFSFDGNVIADYVCQVMSHSPNPNAVPYLFSLIECYISVNYKVMDPMMFRAIIDRVFVSNIEFLKSDPDMIKSGIDIFTKTLEVRPSLVLTYDVFKTSILSFALFGLDTKELFIIKSMLKFWNSLLSLKKGSKEDHVTVDELFQNEQLGLAMVSKLLSSFLQAARSSLENYYSIFRALLGKYPMQLKGWLVHALASDPAINRSKVSEKDLEMFINKLLITRGRRTANEVLKNFWLTTNGLVDYNSQTL